MNENSRSSNSVKNISFGLLAQIAQMVLGFVNRWVFIKCLEKEYLGVNQLFTEILTYLSLAELGIGSAILYSLYKPLAHKDQQTIAALMKFYKKIYTVIAITIFVLGLCLMPFLHNIVKNVPEQLSDDLYIIYALFLINTTASYFFTYKFSILHADQKSYVLSRRNILIVIIQNLLQIGVLWFTKNFIYYLIVQIGTIILGNYWNTFLVKKHYPFLDKYKDASLDPKLRTQIFSNAKSTAIIKLGGLVVNNSTSIILNIFSGLAMVGLLSNYSMLIALAAGLIAQIFTSLTGSIANVNVKESREKKRETFHLVNFANFWFYGTAAMLFILLTEDFITIWIGKDFLLTNDIVCILGLNFYLLGMQNAVWTFKTTFGFFKQGRFLILLTAGIYIALALWLGNFWGLFGILISMTIARLCTNIWYDPFIVFKMGLKYSVANYFKKYSKYLLILIVTIASTYYLDNLITTSNNLIHLMFKLICSLVIMNALVLILFKNSNELNYLKNFFLKFIQRKS